MLPEEALLRSVAPLPLLSSGLRSRVLVAAAESRARRAQGRRVLASVLVLFSLLGCIAWTGPILPSLRQVAGMEAPSRKGSTGGASPASTVPTASSPFSRRETFIAAMGDDWRMVEAEFKSREEFTRRVQM